MDPEIVPGLPEVKKSDIEDRFELPLEQVDVAKLRAIFFAPTDGYFAICRGEILIVQKDFWHKHKTINDQHIFDDHLRQAGFSQESESMFSYAHGDLDAAAKVLEKMGFTRSKEMENTFGGN